MKNRGFTLVELLVTMGIVSVLAALLLPVFKKARELTRFTQCMHNMQQIGIAALRASADNDNQMIGWYNHTAGKYWYEILEPYLGMSGSGSGQSVFRCPSDTHFDPTNMAQTISYAWNYNVLGGGGSGTAGNESPPLLSLATFTKPSVTLMMTDSAESDSWGYIDTYGHSPDSHRHNGKTSAFFLDGHAAAIDVTTVVNAAPYMDRSSVIN